MESPKTNYIIPGVDKTGNVWFNAAKNITGGNKVKPPNSKTKKANVHPYTIAL